MKTWLRSHGLPSLLLAVAYALTGRLSFLARVDDVLVTPVFFLPEGIALAFALHFGVGIWPGIFAGQLCLALIQGLALPPALSISAINSLEAVGAVWLYRRFGGKFNLYDLRSWVLVQVLVFLVLQPFSATFGTLTLFFSGVIPDFPSWAEAWQNWWIGNSVAQSQLTPLLLLLMHRTARIGWAKKIFIPLAITAAALWVTLPDLPISGVGASLALYQPILVGLALTLGLKAVCSASVLISLAFLYATSHGFGPFYQGEATNLLDLNVFLIGISLVGQFLAVLFRQLQEKQREMATRNEDIRLVTEGAGIGFWSRDLRTGLEEWDDQCLRVFGRQQQEFDGRWEPFVHPDDLARVTAESERAIRENRRYEVDYRIRRPDGTLRWVRGLGTCLRDASGQPLTELGINYDITEIKKIQEALEESRQKELRAEKDRREEISRKLKTSLAAAGIAHEINQPLSQILLQSEISLRKLAAQGGKDSESEEAFRTIRSRAEQVVATIETIRALLGNVAGEQRPLDLTNVIRSVVLYLHPQIQQSGVSLSTQGLEKPCPMNGEQSQLHLLVANLLRNAVEAAETRAEGQRKASLTLQDTSSGRVVTIEDSGPGFTTEDKMRSELPIESTKPEGMGMGLFLARTAAENHRATITFSRSPSLGGAKAEVTFPK